MKRLVLLSIVTVCVFACAYSQKPYISKVYEYRPAPGQFINVLPEFEDGDTEAEMIAKCEEMIVGRVGSSNYICLGAWGGYVTFGFDHPLVNVAGEYDFKIYGNAFLTGTPDEEGRQFGSSEPGIIYVSQDTNGNGIPDDDWYEIAGSEAESANRDYSITYGNLGVEEDTPWQDNAGTNGYIARNQYHLQPYYPQWITDRRISFSGTILPPNTAPGSIAPRAYMYEFGYADNWPNDDERSNINLDWAIDSDGNPANLTHVDFIRIQTGVLVDWGISGEMSTEVCGAEDLHPEAQLHEGISSFEQTMYDEPQKILINSTLYIKVSNKYYTIL